MIYIIDTLHDHPILEENSQRMSDSKFDAGEDKSHDGDQARPTTVHAEIHAWQNATQKSQIRTGHNFRVLIVLSLI